MTQAAAAEQTSYLDALIADPKIRRIVASSFLKLAKGVSAASRPGLVKLLSALSTYEKYLSETYQRGATLKTFADPTRPVSLLDHFVEMKLKGPRDEDFNQEDIIARLRKPI